MGKKKIDTKSSKIELEDDIEDLTPEEMKRGSSKKPVKQSQEKGAAKQKPKPKKILMESEDEEEEIESKKAKKKTQAKKRKKVDIDSDDDFVVNDDYDENDFAEEKEIKKALKTKMDVESDLENDSDSENPFKPKKQKVKKNGNDGSKKSKEKPKTTSAGGKKGKTGPSRQIIEAKDLEEKENAAGDKQGNEPDAKDTLEKIPAWAQEPNIRDKKGLYSNQPGYDPTTIYIPENDFKNFGPLMKQYWGIKSNNYDKLVAVKVWKFYYFYFNDAFVVSKILDMKITVVGKNVQTFFHESCMSKFAPKIVEKGYQIMIVEQMEENTDKDVVRREVCQVLSRATYFENPEMDYASRFLMAIFEDNLHFGLCFVDTTTHEIYIGEFGDNPHRDNLRTLLTRMKPIEVVYIQSFLSPETLNMIKNLSHRPTLGFVKIKEPKPFSDIFEKIEPFFTKKGSDHPEYPEMIKKIHDSMQEELKDFQEKSMSREPSKFYQISYYFALQAFNIAVSHLESVLLAECVLPMSNYLSFDLSLEKKSTLYLDNQALQNLEVLEVNYLSSSNESNSLFGFMDHTITPFGKRMFKRWIISPLLEPEKINERLDAIEDLMKNSDIVDYFREKLKKLPDLERSINRIYNLTSKQRLSAIYYEDFAKNRLKEFLTFLKELSAVEDIFESFKDYVGNFKSKRLIQLTSFKDVDLDTSKPKSKSTNKTKFVGIVPRIRHLVSDLEHMVQIKDGIPFPNKGVSQESDMLLEKIENIKEFFDDFLQKQKKIFKSDDLSYVHTKHRYELEIPEELVAGNKKPKNFVITSKRKGYQRFHCEEIENNLNKLRNLEVDFQKVLVPFICNYFKKFYERNAYWQQIVQCLGELDCLCSLAVLAQSLDIRCRPQILPSGDKLIFELNDMAHPVIAKNNPNFVRNDVILKENKELFLITGPNMGGKSTLLRQTCLAVIMAQVGSFVPAISFKLSCVDRIFTRIGAADHIFEGKSTFFVEMEEIKTIVSEASKNSLLIIDELGRGTSTYDGVAIAYSTLKYISEKIGCITLFATHYHLLLEEFRLYQNIVNYNMACEYDEKNEELKFTYKFSEGSALRSHGIIIAKYSGLPSNVIESAKQKAAFMTEEKRNISFEKNLMEKFNKAIENLHLVDTGTFSVNELMNELSTLV